MYHNLQMPTTQSDALSNTPYLTIEELSSAVKRTIEGRFEFVRVRGEVSQLRVPASGHVYFALKDEKNTLSSVIWRGSAARLSVQPEEGLDVICSGKMTTFGYIRPQGACLVDIRVCHVCSCVHLGCR